MPPNNPHMFPRPTDPHSTPTRTPTRPQATSTSTARYATPPTLPAAFGVDTLYMWSSSPATSTRLTQSDRLSIAGSQSSGSHTRPRSEIGISVIDKLMSRPPPPSSALSTDEWVRQTWGMVSNSHGSQTGPSEPASAIPSETKRRGKAAKRSHTPEHMLDPDEHMLEDSDFDVDGSVPDSSAEDEEEPPRRKSKYIDDSAKESKGAKRKRPAPKRPAPKRSGKKAQRMALEESDLSGQESSPAKRRKNEGTAKDSATNVTESAHGNPLNKWSGTSQGLIEFSPLPNNFNTDPAPLWTYSPDGVARQSPNHRALGDIHFSPSFAPGETFHYWVQVGTKEGARWEQYNPGRQHPSYAGYILKGREGKRAPCWTLGAS